MVVISQAPNMPQSLSNFTANTFQAFSGGAPIPGSSRLNGQQFIFRAAGVATPAATANIAVAVQASYPAGQYPNCAFTSQSLTNNVATFVGGNNFVVGQSVKISGGNNSAYNVTANIATANATQFTVAITNANIANAASNTGAAAVIQPVQIYQGVQTANQTANVAVPWLVECKLSGDTLSGMLQAQGSDVINGTIDGSGQTYFNLPLGSVNFALEPPLLLAASIEFSTTNTSHSAVCRQQVIEQ